mgnify:CR=1 FL=1
MAMIAGNKHSLVLSFGSEDQATAGSLHEPLSPGGAFLRCRSVRRSLPLLAMPPQPPSLLTQRRRAGCQCDAHAAGYAPDPIQGSPLLRAHQQPSFAHKTSHLCVSEQSRDNSDKIPTVKPAGLQPDLDDIESLSEEWPSCPILK